MKNIKFLTLLCVLTLVLAGCSQDSGSSRPTFNDPNNPSNGGGPGGCIAVDTDGDGLRDCDDPDIDNDGYLNATDAFPFDRNEWVDTDGDGSGDNGDWAPADTEEWRDSDIDGIGDNADPDDDNDGTPDVWDSFRTRSAESFDIDFDTFGNNEDPDSDNDGVPDAFDDLFWRQGFFDIDLDLLPNESDPDDDGDNVIDEADAFPFDNTEWDDYDSDKIGNNADPDDDNDGAPDAFDDFPLNINFFLDTDGDGFANEVDAFPYDETEWVDSDLDGRGDNSDAFPNNPQEQDDTDGDGVGNNSDPDIDNDGFLNQLPAEPVQQIECYAQLNETTCLAVNNCTWSTQGRCAPRNSCMAGGTNTTYNDPVTKRNPIISPSNCNSDQGCTWTGTICHQLDFFAHDRFEQADADYDGLGDNEDADDDNDGFPDNWDDYKFRRDAFLDFDVDGLFDWILPLNAQEAVLVPAGQYATKIDPDSDNDGVPDFWDDLAWDPSEYFDIDKDQIGDNFDVDDDGDNVVDEQDAFPYDNTEWADTNNNGIGNNTDHDDDNDGAPDVWDSHPLNNIGWSDIDLDGTADQGGDIDIDGDTVPNFALVCTGTTNNFSCSYPENEDLFMYDPTEAYDYELDGLGNNEDPDDDNDGVPDIWDGMPLESNGYSDLNNNGTPDTEDPDIDGDGVENALDTYPYDVTESADTDGDTLGNEVDPDADNDGVPDDFDDFPLDLNYWADADKDGIANEIDIRTPFGINTEADIITALTYGENIALTSDITITQCHNLNRVDLQLFSPDVDDIRSLTYNGPNDGCMFNITATKVSVALTRLIMPENKRGTFIKSANNIINPSIFQNDIIIKGLAKIADLNIAELFNFTRNNILLQTTSNLAAVPGYDALVLVNNGTTIATNADVGFLFNANIIFWDIKASQTGQVFFLKSNGPLRSITAQYNVLSLKKDSAASLVAGSAFFKVDYTGNFSSPNKGIDINSNRVNMNAGQLFNLTNSTNNFSNNTTLCYSKTTESTCNSTAGCGWFADGLTCRTHNELFLLTKDNKIFGISSLGNPVIDSNYNPEDRVCDIEVDEGEEGAPPPEVDEQALCLQRNYCSWTGSTCIANGQLPFSYSTYYNFTQSDVFMAPERGLYWMHYYPNTAKVNNSPALFPIDVYDAFFEVSIIQESDLGLGAVNFVGVFSPVLDTDVDLYPDDQDKFPTNPLEWFDNDADGFGNNSDTDDDNDSVGDNSEKSYCAIETGIVGCNVKTGCSWDSSSQSCRKSAPGCLVSGSNWNSTLMCCVDSGMVCVDGTDPFKSDTDGDGLSDQLELFTYGTNPLVVDSDGDGDSDSEEIANNTNPLNPTSSKDTDGDGLTDNFERNNFIPLGCVAPQTTSDTDGDGLSDGQEYTIYNTNPCISDTDGDGLSDAEEVNVYTTSPTVSDTDGDGLSDGQEVLTHGTNPKVVDSDGDGAGDGQEIIDGTSPTSSLSFKDTDGDNESDYADKTPYGTTPCDNTTLATCNNAFSATDLRTRFNQQIAEVFNCGTKTSQTSCNTNVFGLCKWDSSVNECKPKDLVVFHDLTLDDRCYSTILAANNKTTTIKIRSRPNTRKTLNISNNLASICSSNFSVGEGVFTMLANTGFNFEGLHFNVGSDIPTLIANTSLTSRGGFSLTTKKVSFNSQRSTGANFVKLRDFHTVEMEQTTIRQRLTSNPGTDPLAVLDIKNTGTFCSGKSEANCNISSSICSWNGSSCVDRNNNSLTLKGNIISCETENYLSNLYSQNRNYSCMTTQSRSTDFDGNVLILDDATGLPGAAVEDVANNIYSWKHTQGAGSFIFRNSRIYSKSKTLHVTNSSSSVTATNLSLRNGANTENFDWLGSLTPTPNLIPDSTIYDTVFTGGASSSQLSCASGTSGDYATIHPVYFNPTPIRSFWSLVNRTGPADAVQIPGAVDKLCTP